MAKMYLCEGCLKKRGAELTGPGKETRCTECTSAATCYMFDTSLHAFRASEEDVGPTEERDGGDVEEQVSFPRAKNEAARKPGKPKAATKPGADIEITAETLRKARSKKHSSLVKDILQKALARATEGASSLTTTLPRMEDSSVIAEELRKKGLDVQVEDQQGTPTKLTISW